MPDTDAPLAIYGKQSPDYPASKALFTRCWIFSIPLQKFVAGCYRGPDGRGPRLICLMKTLPCFLLRPLYGANARGCPLCFYQICRRYPRKLRAAPDGLNSRINLHPQAILKQAVPANWWLLTPVISLPAISMQQLVRRVSTTCCLSGEPFQSRTIPNIGVHLKLGVPKYCWQFQRACISRMVLQSMLRIILTEKIYIATNILFITSFLNEHDQMRCRSNWNNENRTKIN